MDKQKVAKELVKIAKEITAGSVKYSARWDYKSESIDYYAEINVNKNMYPIELASILIKTVKEMRRRIDNGGMNLNTPEEMTAQVGRLYIVMHNILILEDISDNGEDEYIKILERG